jgi:hypothetical protein
MESTGGGSVPPFKERNRIMTTFNHYADDSFSSLIARLNRFAEAGIDPAFDNEMEELEREFAERRFQLAND